MLKKKKKAKKGKSSTSLQNSLIAMICSLLIWGIISVTDTLTEVRLPSSDTPAELYSNQTRDDLRAIFSHAINEAKDSIVLVIYALTDTKIISSLKEKADKGLKVTVVHDPEASPYLARKLGSKVKVIKAKSRGLMHQKILVIDQKQTWIGSANMTKDSLQKHGNLVTAIQAEEVAETVLSKIRTMSSEKPSPLWNHKSFVLGPQEMELWFLPDPSASDRVLNLIHSAKKTLRIAMFTWTRIDFAKAVIAAHKRGVDVQVVIDQYLAKGVGAAVALTLCHAGVPVSFSNGNALLHHKMAIIDDEYLVNGSANWTKAAFGKNDDCFIVLHNLTKEQQTFLKKLWNVISLESIPQSTEDIDSLEEAA